MNIFLQRRLPVLSFTIVIFILGICFGSFAIKAVDYSVKQNLFAFFNDFMEGYNQLEYQHSSLISDSIKFNLFNIIIIWAFGISVFIMPLIPVLIFFKGFVLGFTVGFLISEYSLKGILMAISAIFPQNIFIIPAYILAAVFAICFSFRIVKYYRGRGNLKLEDFIIYSTEMAILALITMGGSLLETYISPLLLKLLLRFI